MNYELSTRVVLLGFMGSGKSTLGRQLARRLGYTFYDLDEYLEHKHGRSIASLIAGLPSEARFRALELEGLQELLLKPRIVLALGGGTPCYGGVMDLLDSMCCTVYLDVPVELLCQRLEADGVEKRPLLEGKHGSELRAHVAELLSLREGYYIGATVHVHFDEAGRCTDPEPFAWPDIVPERGADYYHGALFSGEALFGWRRQLLDFWREEQEMPAYNGANFYRDTVGLTRTQLHQQVFGPGAVNLWHNALHRYEAFLRDGLKTQIDEGMLDYMRRLHEHGVLIGLTTNDLERTLQHGLEQLPGADKLLDCLVAENSEGHGSDQIPGYYMAGPEKLKLHPSEVVVFADTAATCIAALSENLFVVAAASPLSPRRDLIPYCDLCLDNWQQATDLELFA